MWKFFIYTLLDLIFKVLIFSPLRVIFLRFLGAKIGKNTILHQVEFFNLYRGGFKNLKIGNFCFIGDETMLDMAENIVLEDFVTVAERVLILTHMNVGYKTHPLQGYFPAFAKRVKVGKGSFIGANVTLLPGIVIGEESFVAAGSVVTENVSHKVLVAGVPARVIRKIGEPSE